MSFKLLSCSLISKAGTLCTPFRWSFRFCCSSFLFNLSSTSNPLAAHSIFSSGTVNRFQVVHTNGVLSEKAILRCGVPQGSILGPLLFLIYINDLTTMADYATVRMYADDTNMTFTACSIPELQHDMDIDLQFLQSWLVANRLTLNVLKTEFMLVGSRQRVATLTQELDLSINGISLKRVNRSKCLGVEIDEFLTWDAHIFSVSKKVSSGIGVLKKIKPFVPTSNLISVYQ